MCDRQDFLLKMYEQLWANINRHILVIWQSVGVLMGSFAVLVLLEKQIINLDIAALVIVIFSVWLIAHTVDSANWVKRNFYLIVNIERQFLLESDEALIHPYFGRNRNNGWLATFWIQLSLGTSTILLTLAVHFYVRVLPGLGLPLRNLDLPRFLPYLALIFGMTLNYYLWRVGREQYDKLRTQSPGKTIEQVTIDT